MLRILVVFTVAGIGLSAGALVGLLAGAAFVEFGVQSCNGGSCADTVMRTCVPISSVIGVVLGFAKGLNLMSPKSVPLAR